MQVTSVRAVKEQEKRNFFRRNIIIYLREADKWSPFDLISKKKRSPRCLMVCNHRRRPDQLYYIIICIHRDSMPKHYNTRVHTEAVHL